jgi:hypothetical protein
VVAGLRKDTKEESATTPEPPRPARRGANRRSVLKTGRTLSAKREHLETSQERIATHQKIKRKERRRLIITTAGFLIVTSIVIWVGVLLSQANTPDNTNEPTDTPTQTVIYKPTIEIVDEDAGDGNAITGRISQYVGQAEIDFRDYGLVPVKAVIPNGAIREVDFYLEGHPGYIKTTLDRDTAVSAEDASRMVRYLEEQGIGEYQYIDVRLEGRAYWK